MAGISRLALLALAACLGACGQKGDLYLPDAAREVVPATPATSPPASGPAGAQAPAADDDDDQNAGNVARPDAR